MTSSCQFDDDAVGDDVIGGAIMLKEENGETDGEKEGQGEVLDNRPHECTEIKEMNKLTAIVTKRGLLIKYFS